MSTYIPVYKKMKYSPNSLITRKLPVQGDLVVKEGDTVVPFTKIGRSKVSADSFILPQKIKLDKRIDLDSYIYKDEVIGKVGFKKFLAPYNGFVTKNNNGELVYFQEMHDVWILSGVWGTVKQVAKGLSVTIETKSIDISFVSSSSESIMGELIVFPNPSDLLDAEYLQKFAGNTKNKIIYIGNHIRKQIVDLAAELKTGALIAGSIDKSTYNYAKKLGVSVSITTGFGHFDTPDYIFEFLKNVSNRHVFVNGSDGLLQVPMPEDNKFIQANDSEKCLKMVEQGLKVMIFNKTDFGEVGIVEKMQDEIIYVKLNKSEKIAEVKIPNIFAIE